MAGYYIISRKIKSIYISNNSDIKNPFLIETGVIQIILKDNHYNVGILKAAPPSLTLLLGQRLVTVFILV